MHNFHRGGDIKSQVNIGKIQSVRKWMDKFLIPYKEDGITRIMNDSFDSFEIYLDQDAMILQYQDKDEIPEFLREGSIKLVVNLKG